ncbi:PIN domain-containing protein [Candidatus Poriferisodalis sp.]|uniref:PIN domain-containing protein n=1 Tax=Candidatus Poriferisodalis sp. TaxID=3101277 RepID=UPI003B5ACB9D
MELTHIFDTSVLTRLSSDAIRAVAEPLVAAGRAARAGISDLEIGFSARDVDEWEKLANSLDELHLIETSADHVRRARQTQRLLAERGLKGRSIPDLLIAAAAEVEQLTVLHYDKDYDFIAEVTGQQCEWVVPRGSID